VSTSGKKTSKISLFSKITVLIEIKPVKIAVVQQPLFGWGGCSTVNAKRALFSGSATNQKNVSQITV
jgi:hypothetical protein